MRAPRSVVAALLLLAPLPVRAAEVLLGWDARGVWTSNVFRSSNDEEDAFSIYQGPDLGLRDPQGDLRYNLEYRPRYEWFVDLDDANAWEHFAVAAGTWDVDRRSQVSIDSRFSESRGLRDVFEPGPSGTLEDGELFVNRDKTLRTTSNASATRWLNERTQLVTNFNVRYYDFEQEQRGDATSFGGGANIRRVLSRRQTVGLGFSASRQTTNEVQARPEDDISFQPENGTTFLQAFAVYNFLIDRNLTLNFSGGPALVMPDEFEREVVVQQFVIGSNLAQQPVLVDRAGCPGDDPARCNRLDPAPVFNLSTGQQVPAVPISGIPLTSVSYSDGEPSAESSLTFFGSVNLSYRRRPYTWVLDYTRRFSNTTGIGTSTNLDIASMTGSWEFARRWRLTGRATWQRQTSSSDLPITSTVLAADGGTVLLNANGFPVFDPADAVYEARNVAEIGSVRVDDESDSAFDATTYTADIRLQHLLTRRLTLVGVASYWYQSTSGDFQADTDRQSIRFEIGVTWAFDPIQI